MSNRNATASWSGYLHQGKVGIFLALKQLRELVENDCDFKEWVVEFESAEDIDIKQGNKVISRHQVKAYKNAKYPNDYKEVLGVLKYECRQGKLKRVSSGFQTHSFDEKGTRIELEVDINSRYLHTITETYGFDLDKTEFTEKYKNHSVKPQFVANPNNIQLYCYPNNLKYCELSNEKDFLLEFSEKEIKTIIDKSNKSFEKNYRQIYYSLLYKLDTEIRNNHLYGNKKYPSISFNDIYSIINSKVEHTRENISLLRSRFAKQWQAFILELEKADIPINSNQESKVEKIIAELYSLKDEKFLQMLRDLNPDKSEIGNLETIEQVLEFWDENSLKDIFYMCLLKVEKEEFDIRYFGYNIHGGYHLTVINRDEMMLKTVINSILSNSSLTEAIFKRKYIINKEFDDVAIAVEMEKYGEANFDLKNNWGRKIREDDHFLNPDISFITVKKAIKQLNDEEQ